ncbi:protein of unknown function [Xenorhabdus doucetiae]|uniref:Uncharacterized protein n=1 Tax=Xenorhabdus doucetiae TaxID=351671 RepID=A0A068QQK7_9GAMM|nr:protein of unknown function [Xenorhabdus doucetiae]
MNYSLRIIIVCNENHYINNVKIVNVRQKYLFYVSLKLKILCHVSQCTCNFLTSL